MSPVPIRLPRSTFSRFNVCELFLLIGLVIYVAVPALFAQDTRTVTEPQFPPSCIVLAANQAANSLDETNFDTARIQTAINNCPSGQAVELQANGNNNAFLIQPITLNAGVTLLVDAEVTVFASINPRDFDLAPGGCAIGGPDCKAIITGTHADGAGIMGYGVIDGRGGVPLIGPNISWWQQGDPRPRMLQVNTSNNFTLYKITLQNSPKFHAYVNGNNFTAWGVKIQAPVDAPNTDGFDPSAVSNATITNSYVSVGDDDVAIKAGIGPVSNVTVSHNHFYTGHGMSIGSETNAGANNVLVTDLVFDGTGDDSGNGLRIKSDVSRGGLVNNVTYDGVCIKNVGNPLVFDPRYSSASGSMIPWFQNITLRNVHILSKGRSMTFAGYDAAHPLGMTLDNAQIDGITAPASARYANFTLGPDPVNFSFSGTGVAIANNVTTSNPSYPCGADRFVYLAGELTGLRSIAIEGQPLTLSAILQPAVFGSPSPAGTVSILEGPNVVASASLSERVTPILVGNPSAGTHTYTAAYSGDNNYSSLEFGSFTITVAPAGTVPTATSLTSSASQVKVGDSITLTATVVSGSDIPTGEVAFFDSSTQLGAVALDASGTARYTTNSLVQGTHNLVASYLGASGYYASNSPAATVSIIPANCQPPVANDAQISVNENSSVVVTLSGAVGAGCSSGDTLTYTVVNGPGNGQLGNVIGTNLTYTPFSNYSGTDSFTFRVTDANATPTDSNVATVTIAVSQVAPPGLMPPLLMPYIVTSVAGTNSSGYSGDNGLATAAQLNAPRGVAVDSSGNIYIADMTNAVIRKVDAITGMITTVAGGGPTAAPFCNNAPPGSANGDGCLATQAYIKGPRGVAVDSVGNIFIADSSNSKIRMVRASDQTMWTVGGANPNGTGWCDGDVTSSSVYNPENVVVGPDDNVYIADTANSLIRKIDMSSCHPELAFSGGTPNCIMSTLTSTAAAGFHACTNGVPSKPAITGGFAGDGQDASRAVLNTPYDLAVAPNGDVFISDTTNCRLRKIDHNTNIISTLAGNGSCTTTIYAGPALTVPFKQEGVVADASGNAYVFDGSKIWFYDAATQYLRRIGGGASSPSNYCNLYNATTNPFGDGCAPLKASFSKGYRLANDAWGNLYIADTGDNRIRKMALGTLFGAPFAPIAPSLTQVAQLHFGVGDKLASSPVDAPPYTFLNPNSCITNGDSTKDCLLNITYTPTADGWQTGALTVPRLLDVPQTFYLQGYGRATSYTATVTADSQSMTYGGTLPALTYTTAPAGLAFDTPPICSSSVTNASTAGTYAGAITCAGAAKADYAIVYAAGTMTVAKATPTIAVTCPPAVAYDGNSHSCTTTATGVSGSSVLGTSTLTYGGSATPPTNPGTYAVVATFTSTDRNYTNASATGQLAISALPVTVQAVVTPVSKTYGDSTVPTYSYTLAPAGVTFSVTPTCDVTPTPVVNAGTYTVTCHDAVGSEYAIQYASATLTVNPATPSVTLTCSATTTYDGNPHSCGLAVTGVAGATVGGTPTVTYNGSVTPPSTPGTYTVVGSFVSSDPNYTNGAIATSSVTINKTTPSVLVSCPAAAFDGKAHACTATATGIGNVSVSGTIAFTYNGSGTVPTSAGTYSVSASFTSTDGNYTNGSGTSSMIINQATPTVAVVCPTSTYDGAAHVCAATATGVGNVAVNGTMSFTYSGNATAPTNAGSYPVSASFTSTDGNYANGSGTSSLTINKAVPSMSLSTSSITGALGAPVTFLATLAGTNATGQVTFNDGPVMLGTATLGSNGQAALSTSSLVLGPHNIAASYSGDGNFTGSTATPVIFTAVGPIIKSLSPPVARAESPDFTLAVNGDGFAPGVVLRWNGSDRTTSVLSTSALTAKITATDLASVNTADVTVFNPAVGGALSPSFKFAIDTPAATTGAITVTAESSTLNVIQGASATVRVTFGNTMPGVTITGKCLNLPLNATCTYDDLAKTLTITSAATTPKGSYQVLAIFTATQQIASNAHMGAMSLAWSGLSALPFGLLMIGSRRRAFFRSLLALASLLLVLSLAGCGGRPTSPANPQSVTVQASAALTMNVN